MRKLVASACVAAALASGGAMAAESQSYGTESGAAPLKTHEKKIWQLTTTTTVKPAEKMECPEPQASATEMEPGAEKLTAAEAVPEPIIAIHDRVGFETNSAELSEGSKESLGQVAEILKANPDIAPLQIAGYTDSTGPASLNEKLSEQRAESVRAFFEEQGIDSSRLEVTGFAEREPAGSNDTSSGRAMNRRVEISYR